MPKIEGEIVLSDEMQLLKEAIVDAISDEIGPTVPACRPVPPADICKAIIEVAGKIKRLEKGEYNKFQHYKFTSVDDFYEFIGPIMAESKIFSYAHKVSEEVSTQESTDDRGTVKKSVWLTSEYDIFVYHENGSAWGPLRQPMRVPASGAQAFGGSESYVQKQFLRGLFKIPTGDSEDADHYDQPGLPNDRRAPPAQRKEQPKYSAEESANARDRMVKELAELPLVERDLLHWVNLNDAETNRMTEDDSNAVTKAFYDKRDAIRGQAKLKEGDAPF